MSDTTPFGKSNTRVNALEAKRIVDQSALKRPIVIAQQWRAGRVKAVFSRAFGEDMPVVIAWSEYNKDVHQTRLSNPLLFHLWELLATIMFKLKGWI